MSISIDNVNFIHGTDLGETIEGSEKTDIIAGLKGDDKIFGYGGDDVLLGNEDDDILLGCQGDDFVHGGKGDDVLVGGSGKDTYIGGQGEDLFVLEENCETSAYDIFADFNAKEDTIAIHGLGIKETEFTTYQVKEGSYGQLIAENIIKPGEVAFVEEINGSTTTNFLLYNIDAAGFDVVEFTQLTGKLSSTNFEECSV